MTLSTPRKRIKFTQLFVSSIIPRGGFQNE
nr:MAG TPA: hypothetical protein [Caudoviricetes sp.]